MRHNNVWIDERIENINDEYRLMEPKDKTRAIENLINIILHDELAYLMEEERYNFIESIGDFNVDLYGLGDNLYKIRLNLVYQIIVPIRDAIDVNNAVKILTNRIWYSNRNFKDKSNLNWG